ncbi:UNKNOWN [Stylonychia lemnae]|uniref:Transmembrane protein n=1 Tax=Stylonychia lemnae TaxID=5949 RepID=A0A078AX00_STYLE|nr:UNKNOWN [Stylonychia lemnae]|eukprot:CDW86694.1 UNKNOWN [Stylonychia lemnae]
MEILNEIIILGLSYSLYLFSNFVEDYELQYTFGWCVICLVLLNMIGNIAVMLIQSISSILPKLKKIIYKLRNWSQKRKQKLNIDQESQNYSQNKLQSDQQKIDKTADNDLSTIQRMKQISLEYLEFDTKELFDVQNSYSLNSSKLRWNTDDIDFDSYYQIDEQVKDQQAGKMKQQQNKDQTYKMPEIMKNSIIKEYMNYQDQRLKLRKKMGKQNI